MSTKLNHKSCRKPKIFERKQQFFSGLCWVHNLIIEWRERIVKLKNDQKTEDQTVHRESRSSFQLSLVSKSRDSTHGKQGVTLLQKELHQCFIVGLAFLLYLSFSRLPPDLAPSARRDISITAGGTNMAGTWAGRSWMELDTRHNHLLLI